MAKRRYKRNEPFDTGTFTSSNYTSRSNYGTGNSNYGTTSNIGSYGRSNFGENRNTFRKTNGSFLEKLTFGNSYSNPPFGSSSGNNPNFSFSSNSFNSSRDTQTVPVWDRGYTPINSGNVPLNTTDLLASLPEGQAQLAVAVAQLLRPQQKSLLNLDRMNTSFNRDNPSLDRRSLTDFKRTEPFKKVSFGTYIKLNIMFMLFT